MMLVFHVGLSGADIRATGQGVGRDLQTSQLIIRRTGGERAVKWNDYRCLWTFDMVATAG